MILRNENLFYLISPLSLVDLFRCLLLLPLLLLVWRIQFLLYLKCLTDMAK